APGFPNTRDILIRQRHRNSRFEPCDTLMVQHVRSEPALGKALWQEYVRGEVNESKLPWRHSDHLARNEIDQDSAAKRPRIAAELPLPISISKDHGLRRTRTVICAREPSA